MNAQSKTKNQTRVDAMDANKLDLRNEIQEKHRTRAVPWFAWVFDQLELGNNCQVLELGSGPGAFWVENAGRVPEGWQVTLTDIDGEMLQVSRDRLQGAPPGPQFAIAPGQHLPFPGDQFDAVLAVGVLDLIPDLDTALDEIWRVLRPGGKLYASAGGKNHLIQLRRRLRAYAVHTADQVGGNEEAFGLENGAAKLSSSFEEVVRHDFHDQMVFTEIQPVLNYVLSEQALVWEMTIEQLGQFANYLKQDLHQKGQVRITVEKALFAAQKKVTA